MSGNDSQSGSHYFASTWSFVFTLSFILCLPFSYSLFPDFAGQILPYIQVGIQKIGSLVWEGAANASYPVYSDSVGMLLLTGILIIISFLITVFIYWCSQQQRPCWAFASRTLATYYLSLMLFKYGFDKLFKHQFYLPEPNTLFTPLGQLSPDMLYWSTMGVSYPYNIFLGLAEIIPAALLLWRRTRLLGALMAMGVLVNVFMINWSFGISVKLLAGFLLFLSSVLITPYLSSFLRLGKGEPSQLPQLWRPSLDSPRKIGGYTLLKSWVLFLILVECLNPYWSNGHWNDDRAARPPMHGAYAVLSMEVGDTTYSAPNTPIQHIFVHRQAYLILQDNEGQLTDFPFRYAPQRRAFSIQLDQGQNGVVSHTELKPDSTLQFLFSAQLPYPGAQLEVKAINWKKLPVFTRPPHWLDYE